MKPLQTVDIGGGRVRSSDADLHRAASMAIYEANHVVFEALPSVIRQIIEHKTWRTFGHKDFASYALDATSNGLGVNTNQRLWILRCSMDVQGRHIKEWADVLSKVEEMVRLEAANTGATIMSFNGNSLETLAKTSEDFNAQAKITYLPSRSGPNVDGYLVRLRRNKPDVYKRVVSGQLTISEARKNADTAVGMRAKSDMVRAKSLVRNMTPKERREFIAWMRDAGLLD